MTLDAASIAKRIRRLYSKQRLRTFVCMEPGTEETPPEELAKYKDDPVGFCSEVLGIELTDDQKAIIRSLPGRVKVNSGHSLGKSTVAACAVLWWFYTRNPSVVVTTAPTKHHVETILWAEIRLLALRAKKRLPQQFLPKAAKIYDHPDHWAEGITAATGEGFQGRHRPSMLFIYDECEDVSSIYWSATDTMYQPGADHGWLAIGNPLTTSSQSYLEDQAMGPDGNPKWKVFNLSSLNHPNVKAQLQGLDPPIPNAVTLPQVQQWLHDWTTAVPHADISPGDIEFPPASGKWYRPGPMFLARVMGIRPTTGVNSVFSELCWERMDRESWEPRSCWERNYRITIGCDPAAFGDDFTTIHVRSGPLSLHHEAHNGWDPGRTAGRIKELCREYARVYNSWATTDRPQISPYDVDVAVETDGGLGIGVLSHRQEFMRWRGVTVGSSSQMLDMMGQRMYLNTRSEMWNEGAKKALGGMIDLHLLPQDVRHRLKSQLLTPFYVIRADGTRQVESKADIKKRTTRSPDDADSLLISHYDVPSYAPTVVSKEDDGW